MTHETETYEELKSWITEYIKHKDIFQKSIVAIKPGESGVVIVEYKTKKMSVFIEPHLVEINRIYENIRKGNEQFDSVLLVVLNTKENLNKIIDAWERLSQLAKLSICFVNPSSENEKRWIISPFTHNRITQRNSLKPGLMSIFATVDPVKAIV